MSAYYFANAVRCYFARLGVFDRVDMPDYFRVYFRVLESAVATLSRAVYEFKIFAVAKRLSAYYTAVYKRKIFGIPPEVFSL